ncbi:hypothetical protein LCGC14_1628030 [marine sediment metagenome]|uniref:Uncharacterized protein n=1 Tax=marine sediment metagenome TaxID=412755 RepID=A0A0F9IQJ7_9ZZZZ
MYPAKEILIEMLDECVPELRGCGSEVMLGFVNDIKRPYQESVIAAM